MKLAVLVPSLAHRGPIIVASNIINNLAKKIGVIDVYYFDDKVEVELEANIFRMKFLRSFEFDDYDIVHSHMLRPDLYICLNRKKIRAKCISTIHQYILDDLRHQHTYITYYCSSRLWFHALKRFDQLVTLSSDMEEYYRHILPKSKITHVHNGCDIDKSNPQIDKDDEERINSLKRRFRIIGSAATLTANKGLGQILYLLREKSNYAFVIIGDGRERASLERLAKRLNVNERCMFLGYRDRAHRYFKYFDVFAMTSRKEGVPVSILEAAQYSIPTVCSNTPVFKELFNEREVAYFELGDIGSISSAISRIEKNAGAFACNMNKKYLHNFTGNIMAEKYLDIYNKVLGRGVAETYGSNQRIQSG